MNSYVTLGKEKWRIIHLSHYDYRSHGVGGPTRVHRTIATIMAANGTIKTITLDGETIIQMSESASK